MTCIIGLAQDDTLYMGADSAATGGWEITTQRQPKIFRAGDLLIGVSGYPRMLQILKYRFAPPAHTPEKDDMHYMAVDFVDAARQAFKDAGYAQKENEQERTDSLVLIGYRGHFYTLERNYQIIDSVRDYATIGSGDSYALGALHATVGLGPLDRIRLALEAAAEYSTSVRGPFVYLMHTLEHAETATLAAVRAG